MSNNRFNKKKTTVIEPISFNTSKTKKSIKEKSNIPESGKPEQKAQDNGFIQEWF